MAFKIIHCVDCAFWVARPDGRTALHGECHLNPPIPSQHGDPDAERESSFLITEGETDWCAQAEKKK